MPTAAWRAVDTVEDGHGGDRALPGGDQVRRARRGQGRRHRRRRGRGARGARGLPRASSASATGRVRRRGAPRGRGALAAGAVRRRARACRWRRRRTTSASSTATTGPNTGGMGSYSPVPGIDRARVEESCARSTSRSSTSCAAAARPSTACLYAGLMLTADGPRCSSSTCASATPRRRPCCRGCARTCSTCCSARRVPGGLAGAELEWDDALGGQRRARQRRLSGVVVHGRRHRRARRASARTSRSRTPARRGRRRRDRHRRRPRAQRHRAGRRSRRRPRRRLCCRRPDHLRGPAAAPRHRAAGRGAHGDERVRRRRPEPSPQTDPETEFADLDVDAPRVGIIMGSKSDMAEMEKAGEVLAEHGHPLRDPRHVGAPRPRHGRRLLPQRAHARAAGDHRRRRPVRRAARASPPRTPTCRSSASRFEPPERRWAVSTRSSRSCRCRRACRSRASAWTTRATRPPGGRILRLMTAGLRPPVVRDAAVPATARDAGSSCPDGTAGDLRRPSRSPRLRARHGAAARARPGLGGGEQPRHVGSALAGREQRLPAAVGAEVLYAGRRLVGLRPPRRARDLAGVRCYFAAQAAALDSLGPRRRCAAAPRSRRRVVAHARLPRRPRSSGSPARSATIASARAAAARSASPAGRRRARWR